MSTFVEGFNKFKEPIVQKCIDGFNAKILKLMQNKMSNEQLNKLYTINVLDAQNVFRSFHGTLGMQDISEAYRLYNVNYINMNAVNFYVTNKFLVKIGDNLKNWREELKESKLRSFKLPLSDLTITVEYNDLLEFLSYFEQGSLRVSLWKLGDKLLKEVKNSKGPYFSDFYITVSEMTEKYQSSSGEMCPIYTIKLNGKIPKPKDREDLSDTIEMEDGSIIVVFHEFTFIPQLYPRIFCECPKFESCTNVISTNISDNFYNNGHERPKGMRNSLCQRTKRTCINCVITDNNLLDFGEDTKVGEQCYYLLSLVTHVIDRYNARLKSLITSEKRLSTGLSCTNTKKAEPKNVQIKPVRIGSSITIGEHRVILNTENMHVSHNSPREHERREHIRHLRNGKVINVRTAIVNKGHDKTPYKID